MKASYIVNVRTTDPLLISHIRSAKQEGFFKLLGDQNGEPEYEGFHYAMNDVEKEMRLSAVFDLNAPLNNNIKCLETLQDDYDDTDIVMTTHWDDGYFAVFSNGAWVTVE
jgi:hypothetical protein